MPIYWARVETGLMLVCLRCGHSWLRRSIANNTGYLPRSAASPYWNRPERERSRRRYHRALRGGLPTVPHGPHRHGARPARRY